MPLTPGKVARIRATVARTFQGRQQQVILTLRTPAGSTTTLTVDAVWRVMSDSEPAMEAGSNDRFHIGGQDVVAIFNAADITLPQLRSCIWAVLGADATGAQPAIKYTVLHVEPFGMVPGSDRFYTIWTRQR